MFKLKEWIANVSEWIKSTSTILAEIKHTTRPIIVHQAYTYNSTAALASGATLSITGNDIGLTAPTGYSTLGIRNAYSATAGIAIDQFRCGTGSGQTVRIKNEGSSSISSYSVIIGVNFIRSDYYANLAND